MKATQASTKFFVSAELADWMNGQSFYEWQAAAGYDTRPYYQAASGRVRLPVAHSVARVDSPEVVEYEGNRVALLATIQTLHALGVEIVIPDYSGCNLDGETRLTPADYGCWSQLYRDFRD